MPSSLLNFLTSYWKLDECGSSNRVDSTGLNDLVPVGTVACGMPKLGTHCAQFSNSGFNYLFVDESVAGFYDTHGRDMTLAGWVWFNSLGGTMKFAGRANGSSNFNYTLRYEPSSGKWYFRFNDGGTQRDVAFTMTASTNTWYWVCATLHRLDLGLGTVTTITVNNAAPSSYTSALINFGADHAPFMLGRGDDTDGNSADLDGNLDGWGVWDRVLDPEEKTVLYNGGVGLDYPFDITTLCDGLVSSWKMDETQGIRFDSIGTNDLLPVGIIDYEFLGTDDGNAAVFTNSVQQTNYLYCQSNTTLQTLNKSWTVTGWLYFAGIDLGRPPCFAGKSNGGTNWEWDLRYQPGSGQWVFRVMDQANSGAKEVRLDLAASGGDWHFVEAWVDSSAKKAFLSVDACAPSSVSSVVGFGSNSTAPFRLGWGHQSDFIGLSGDLDSWLYWSRVLTTVERDDVWNDGIGLEFTCPGSGTRTRRNDITLFLQAGGPAASVPLFVDGGAHASGGMPLVLGSNSGWQGQTTLFVYGNTSATRGLPLYLNAGNIPKGSGSKSLFVFGSTHSGWVGGRDLFLACGNDGNKPSGRLPLFLGGANSDLRTKNMNLFIQGGAYQAGKNTTLFIGNSGVAKGIPLFVSATGMFENYVPYAKGMPLFIKRAPGDAVTLYIKGPGQPTSTGIPLLMAGGIISKTGVVPLSLANVVGSPNATVQLYSHGF